MSKEIILTDRKNIQKTNFNDTTFIKNINIYKNSEQIIQEMLPTLFDISSKKTESELKKMTLEDLEKEISQNKTQQVQLQTEDFVNELAITINSKNKGQALFIANRKARLICNLPSYKSKMAIEPTFKGYTVQYKDGTTNVLGSSSFRVIDYIKIKVQNKEIINVEQSNLNEYYERYFNGILYLNEYKDPVIAIKEFYQIIEDNKSKTTMKNLLKYSSLRHVLSHGDPIRAETKIKLERDFGAKEFEFTSNNKFDYYSESNRRNLFKHAKYLERKLNSALRK